MSLYKRGRIYWCEFEFAGKRYRYSTGTGDRGKARIEEARLKVQVSRDTPPRPRRGAAPELSIMGGADVENVEKRGKSPGYVAAIASMWRNLVRVLGPTLADVDHRSLEDYAATRRKEGARGQTIRRELGRLQWAFKRCELEGVPVDPPRAWPKIESDPSDPRRTGKLVEPAVLRAYLAELPADLRDEWTVAALTGLRQGELARLTFEWVRLSPISGWTVVVPQGGGKRRLHERIVSLPEQARKILVARSRRHEGLLFPRERWNGRRALDRAAKRLGLPHRLTLRDLRTTYGTTALVTSGDAAAVMAALGHSDLRTTQRYQRSTLQRVAKVGAGVAATLRLGTRRRVPTRSPHKKRKAS